MNDELFEELELYVQTLAFQVETLRMNCITQAQKQSLQTLEADYQRCKSIYDQAVAKSKKPTEPQKMHGDW